MNKTTNKCPYGCDSFADVDSMCSSCANPFIIPHETERCACGQRVEVLSNGKLAEHGCKLPFLPTPTKRTR